MIYTLLASMLISSNSSIDACIGSLLLLGGAFVIYTCYQEEKWSAGNIMISLAQGIAHFIALCLLAEFARFVLTPLYAYSSSWIINTLVLSLGMIPIGGVIAGTIFGANLVLTCRYFGINNNDAFSALRLDYYRNFLRLKIIGDELWIYPIGLDRMPRRDEWSETGPVPGSPSKYHPSTPLQPHLIENPIVIDANSVSPVRTLSPGGINPVSGNPTPSSPT